jgi:proteasome lid subunit RPN8/RPN11
MAFAWFDAFIQKLFPRVTRYRFADGVLENMRAMSLQTHPKEAIGMLQGAREGNELVIHTIIFQPFKNTAYSATIHIDPTLTNIVGTFHSHPGASAEPSDADLELFAEHAGVHVIVPEPYTRAVVHDSSGRVLDTLRIPLRGGREESRVKWRARRENR